jgi:hypothetical protein
MVYLSSETHRYLQQLPAGMITWTKPPVLIGCNSLHIYPAPEQSSLWFGTYKLWDDDPPRTHAWQRKYQHFWPCRPHVWISSTNETTIRSPQAPSNESNLPHPKHEQNLEHTQTPNLVKQGQHLPTYVDQTTTTTTTTKQQQHLKKVQKNPKRPQIEEFTTIPREHPKIHRSPWMATTLKTIINSMPHSPL